MNLREFFKNCPLFAGVDEEGLDRLLRVGRQRQAPKGQLLFADGQKAEGFYLLVSGKVKIYKLSPEGKERILHIIHPGETFAEAAIFGSGLYPACADTMEETSTVFFPRKDFLSLLESHPRIAIGMIGGLSSYLRLFTRQIEELTFKDVPARLARYLSDLAGKGDTVSLPVTKSQLASNLGTVSETLSRTLRKLADEEIIEVNGKQISILDRGRLEDLAETYKE